MGFKWCFMISVFFSHCLPNITFATIENFQYWVNAHNVVFDSLKKPWISGKYANSESSESYFTAICHKEMHPLFVLNPFYSVFRQKEVKSHITPDQQKAKVNVHLAGF